MLVIIWEYKVKKTRITEFEKLYNKQGKWVDLFSEAEGFVDTELIKNTDKDNVYVTIDRWESNWRYQAFLEDKRLEYTLLDNDAEKLTLSERKIGEFTKYEEIKKLGFELPESVLTLSKKIS